MHRMGSVQAREAVLLTFSQKREFRLEQTGLGLVRHPGNCDRKGVNAAIVARRPIGLTRSRWDCTR